MNHRHPPLRKTALAMAVTVVAGGAAVQDTFAATCSLTSATTWHLAGSADWTTASAWTPATVPNSTATNTCITSGTGTVALKTTQSVNSLQIAAGNGLNITTGNLIIGGTSLVNSGAITNASFMELANNVTLSGTGTMTLAGGQIGTNSSAYTLTNQSTIQGNGVIGSNSGAVYQNVTFRNSGTVNANTSGKVLSIQGTGGDLTNTGTLKASGSGILSLAPSGHIANAGGTIVADGGTVNLTTSGGHFVQGGTLSTLNGGVLQTVGSAGLDGSTSGAITFASGTTYTAGAAGSATQTFTTGALQLGTGSTIALGGALELAGNTMLNGTGIVTMNAGQIGTNSNALTLTNNVTIQGSGTIGSGSTTYASLGVVNHHLVNANVSGATLSIQGTGATFVNDATLSATNGATLTLATQAPLVNKGGLISASGSGSVVNLQGQTVLGGTLSTSGGGAMKTVTSATLDGSTAANGAITIANGSTYTAGAAGTVTQTFAAGAINLGTGSGATFALGGALELTGDTTFAGASGVITMNAGQIGTNSNSLALTNKVTIQGSGTIGSNSTTYQNLSLANQGLITANVAGQKLSVQGTGTSFVNTGTLSATNGATLTLATQAQLVNKGGTISASGSGSVVNLQGQTVLGGTLSTSGGGVMQTVTNATLDGSTAANGAITVANGSTYTAGAAGTGTQTFATGAINLGTGTGATFALGGALELTGDTTFAGTSGIVTMNAGQIGTNANALTLTNKVTIQGSGTIGSNSATYQNLSLANQGVINANVAGQTLSLQGTGASIVNAGTMKATNGATLNLATQAAINNTGGSIQAVGSKSTVNLSGVTIQGGTLATSGGGVLQAVTGAVLDGLAHGAITLASSSTYTAAKSTLTKLVGQLNLGTGTTGSTVALGGQLQLTGAATVSGPGSITLSGGEIGTNSNALTLTNQSKIQGSGLIGSNNGALYQNLSVVNNGTIVANASGKTLEIGGTGTLTGTGTLQTSGGAVNLSIQSNSTQGKLVMGGLAGSALNLNGHSLTVTNDYTNSAWGTGNSFNRMANITTSGTGNQLIASGNVAQALATAKPGATVTNGTTATPTLTIGNVHVGSQVVAFNVANTGTSGPALRGALQPGVNGGSITDTRLSGFNNWGPAAAGGTATASFSFAVANAGVYSAIASGQKIAVVNNFQNTNSQVVSVKSSAGAAAYNLASATVTSATATLAAQRIGGTLGSTLTIKNTAPVGAYTEKLDAAFGTSSGSGKNNGATASLIAANGTNTGLQVRVNTTTAGAKSGSATVLLTSDGSGTSGLGLTSIASKTINIAGTVYGTAIAKVNTPTIDFGIVHKGATVASKAISISNTAPVVSGYNDTLLGSVSNTGTTFTSTGKLTGVAAGTTDAASLHVAISTATAGSFTGTSTIALSSHDSALADLGLTSATVALKGQVNNYASDAFGKLSGAGTFSGSGTSYTLNFGTLKSGATALTAGLDVFNSATGLADLLSGSFLTGTIGTGDDFSIAGFDKSFSGLAAGSKYTGLTVNFGGTKIGSFDEVVTLKGVGSNASGYSGALTDVQLHLIGIVNATGTSMFSADGPVASAREFDVSAVPEPSTYALMLSGLLAMVWVRRRDRAVGASRL